jgi:hypothetical protein
MVCLIVGDIQGKMTVNLLTFASVSTRLAGKGLFNGKLKVIENVVGRFSNDVVFRIIVRHGLVEIRSELTLQSINQVTQKSNKTKNNICTRGEISVIQIHS